MERGVYNEKRKTIKGADENVRSQAWENNLKASVDYSKGFYDKLNFSDDVELTLEDDYLMLDYKISPKAEKYIKKLKDKELKDKFRNAITAIRQNPAVGTLKKANLKALQCLLP